MADIELDSGHLRELQKEYLDFLDDDNESGVYSTLVKDMIKMDEIRLIVNMNDLRKKKPSRAGSLLSNSFEELIAFERSLRELVASLNPEYLRRKDAVFIGLEGSFGSRHVTPRTLTSRFLGQIVCVEGIVTKCSLVRPKVVKSVHYCPVTKKFLERKYSDMTSYDATVTSGVYPTKDEEGNLLETEYGLSTYKDHQTFTIQEMPEKAPPGQLPRSVDIIVDNDLVDECKPGDRVQVIGCYRCMPSKQGVYTSGTFRCILLGNNLKLLSKEVSPHISAEDVKKCKKFSRQKGDVFHTLARSLAPSIHGHELIKKALLCMLLGGVEKILPNGTRLRGDINIMLIGDPSTAKSQLLRYVLHSAPRAIPTTGRGSSGVGLTAAVVSDFETGERRLEAGAMVLADRGVVCIDEFDKMSDMDRTAIHEVMEQGRVTITKAGINARLNARCSVLAAANPVYGRYDEYKSPMENIGMQDSLLSRFDLLFIILDKHERESDQAIADHVVRMHRYRATNEADGEPLSIHSTADFLTTKDLEHEAEEEDGDTPIYERYNTLLHGNRAKNDKIVSVKFMKKYIHIAKSMKPTLTDEARDTIAEEYAKLRSLEREQDDLARTQPITARALETMIRLATAHAKGRMSINVELVDAHAAIELVQFAYFKKIVERPRKKRRASDGEEYGTEDEADFEDEQGMDSGDSTRKKKEMDSGDSTRKKEMDSGDSTQRKKKERKSQPLGPLDGNEYMPQDDGAGVTSQSVTETTIERVVEMDTEKLDTEKLDTEKLDTEKLDFFKKILNDHFQKQRKDALDVEETIAALTEITHTHGVDPFTRDEIHWALREMEKANQVMVVDGQIFLI